MSSAPLPQAVPAVPLRPSMAGEAPSAQPKTFDPKDLRRLALEFIAYLFFLIFFSLATFFARGDQSNFYLTDRMENALKLKEIDEGRAFASVYTFDDIYTYLDGPFLNFLLDESLPNNESLPLDDRFYPNQHNKLLGIRLRQIRVQAFSCSIDDKYDHLGKLSQCFADLSDDTEDTEPLRNSSGGALFFWQSEGDTKEASWFGQYRIYPGSGYVEDLPLNLSLAKERVAFLRANNWIRPGVRVVLADFQAYNPGANLHFIGRLSFEIGDTGGVLPKSWFNTAKLNRYFRGSGHAQAAFEIIFLIILAGFVAYESRKIYLEGTAYWSRKWNWVDWINFALFFATIGIRIASLAYFSHEDAMRRNSYRSMHRLFLLYNSEGYLSSINAFFMWIKLFKFFKPSRRMQFLFRMFSKASTDLLYFLILFIIFFLGFAQAGYLAFSSDTRDFRSFSISLTSLFRAITGALDFDDLVASNRVYGVLFVIAFQVCVILICVNVFLAIVTDAYAAVREEDEKLTETVQYDVVADFRMMVSKFFRGESEDDSLPAVSSVLKDADVNKDNKVSAVELQEQLKRAGQSEEEARKTAQGVFSAFDENKDGTLDPQEQARLRKAASEEAQPTNAELMRRINGLERLLTQLLSARKQ